MNQISKLSREMNTLIKTKNFKQALELFIRYNRNEHIENDILISDHYILCHILKSFRKINKPLFGYRFITKKIQMSISIECNKFLLKGYAWTIFDLLKRKEKSNELETEINEATLILINELIKDFKEFHFEIVNLIFKIISNEKEKYETNWSLIIKILDLLDHNYLSVESSYINFVKDGKDKTIENASELEKWFAEKTRALEKLKLYDECINLSNEALKTIQKFHYDNDIWFKRHIAISKGRIGNIKEAIVELKSLVQIRNRWFIYFDIAKFYYELNENSEALLHAIKASLGTDSIKKKIKVYELIAEIYEKLNDNGKAKMHYEFILAIRKKNNWSTDNYLVKAARYNIAIHKLTLNRALITKMNDFWSQNLCDDKSNKKSGFIKKLYSEKKFGFIKGEDRDYFFKFSSINFSSSLLNENKKIYFNTEQSYDNKKKENSIIAVNITLNKGNTDEEQTT